MRLFGLIGYPLAQSFSKKYFTEKFAKEGINDCRYELFEIPAIEHLPLLLQSAKDLAGLNVTIPYKKQVIQFLNDKSQLPAGLDACNCIRIDNGKLSGYNTDVTGFERSFIPLLKKHQRKALILGSGGATSAVTFVLRNLGIEYSIVSRSKNTRAQFSYEDLDEQVMNEHQVVINTTPLGSFPSVEQSPPIPYQFINSRHYLFDVVYNPAESLFLAQGKRQGATVKNGYDWLLIQAEESWRIWNE